VEVDESNDKFIIYLATDMAKDVYYVVKAKFYGNMTHDKGFYYTYYDDINDPTLEPDETNNTTTTKYFATTFLEPNNARRLFPCFDDHVFRTPFDITVSRREDMTTESSPDLEDKEVIMYDKLFIDEYNATNAMKASEVALTITNMSPHMYNINNNLSLIFYTRNLHLKNTKLASMVIPKILTTIENYVGKKYLKNKIKYVTVPNSDLTLSEIKSGMIISSEMHIITDKNFTTFSDNFCYEWLTLHVSKLFMQDYISYKAREHLWLHDAFALYLQTTALSQLDKKTQAEHLILEDRLNGMRDELNYKYTSLQYCNQQHLDDNDYYNFIKRKGASILRMIASTITDSVLRNAFQHYFTKM
jgi:aminopeptidase N